MQHVYKYAANARELAKEVVGDLTDEQVVSLQGELKELGLSAFREWREAHNQDINEYMAATPLQRSKKKDWKDNQTKLAFAAYWNFQLAAKFLTALDDPDLHPGGSYRQMAADAYQIHRSLRTCSVDVWPFVLPNPFLKDE